MGYYAGFKYGTGVLYGIQCDISSVDPITGPSPGGNRFVMTGEGFDPRQWDDAFTEPALDSKWTDLSTGSGATYTGVEHLRLVTGTTAASVSGIESDFKWNDVQGEVRAILEVPLSPPTDTVIVCKYALHVDESNYANMYITMDNEGILSLKCETWVGGLKSDEMKSHLEWSLGLSTLKILRWGSTVYFIANGTVIWSTVKFRNNPASFRISSENLTQDYDVNILKIEWFYFRAFAVFQNQPVHDTVVVSNRRVRGLVPASRDIRLKSAAFKGFVDISMVGITMASVPDSYEYYFINGLRAINEPQFSMGLDIINDPQLETPDDAPKGLGDGY